MITGCCVCAVKFTKMWGFCDKCAIRIYDTALNECDYCGDYFCDQCGFESVICCSSHGEKLDFCKAECMREYRDMHGKCEVLRDIDYDGDSDDNDD
jgi:hypothetical protein